MRDEFSILRAARMHENARKYVESAVAYAGKDWSPELTFAAVHLAAGLELLLKARLVLEDHTLLARNPAVTQKQFEQGDFQSIRTDECLQKLEGLNILTLSPKQMSVLQSIQRLRNRALHYLAPSDIELKAALGAGLNLYLELERSEFDFWDPPLGCQGSYEFFEDLRGYDGFVSARMAAIQDDLAQATRPRTRYYDECPCCVQDAICIEDDYFHCLFCGHENLIAYDVECRSADKVVDQCPACSRQSFARHEWYPEGFTKECFCCGYCEGREPKWIDWKTRGELPRLHTAVRIPALVTYSSISPESLKKLHLADSD